VAQNRSEFSSREQRQISPDASIRSKFVTCDASEESR
jgi:hypothetical protein